jgi:hypothetical protein
MDPELDMLELDLELDELEQNELDGETQLLEPELDELDLEIESEVPEWPQWPTERRFDPGKPETIKTGRYQTSASPPACWDATQDFTRLRGFLKKLEEHLQDLRRNTGGGSLDPRRLAARRLLEEVKKLMTEMRKRAANGTYARAGCGPREFAKLTCQMRTLHGFWCNSTELRRLRCELVFTLRQKRGSFATTDCSKLGVALAKNWCAGHNCCCPGTG